MLNTPINVSPRLTLTDPEMIEAGVMLRNINLILKSEKVAPFCGSIFEVAPDAASPIDQHAVKEIWLIIKGNGDLHYNGKIYKAGPQDLFYFEPHYSHQIFNHSDELLVVCSIYW